MLPRAAVTSRRIHEVLSLKPSVVAPKQPLPLPQKALSFSFEDVTVQYPGAEEPVLQRIDATLAPGTISAIIGSTGSGKSTFANLLPRLMDPLWWAGRSERNRFEKCRSRPRCEIALGSFPKLPTCFPEQSPPRSPAWKTPSKEERERILRALGRSPGSGLRLSAGGRNGCGS